MAKWKGGVQTKPSWDDFYMALAYTVAQRSVDESTVHGACLVSKDHRLLSIGYNGPVRGSDPDESDLKTRPNKYFLMIHAEENCIINYHGSYSDLEGSTMYITGEPCHRCLRMILQKGIDRIIYGGVESKCVDEEDKKAKEIILKNLPDYRSYSYSCGEIKTPRILKHDTSGKDAKKVLIKAINYIEYKEKKDG